VWSGKWAFSVEGFAEGNASKFHLVAGAPAGGAVPPSEAEFEGFFVLQKETEEGPRKVKIKEAEVKVSFTSLEDGNAYRMHGAGVNKFGRFTLEGRLDGKSKKASCTKTYEGEDAAAEDEGSDADVEIDADEVADELADLRDDALLHGLVPAAQLRRKRPVDDSVTPTAAKKKKKPVEAKVGNPTAETVPVAAEADAPAPDVALWDATALGKAESRLKEAVAAGDEASVLAALVALRDGGRISVELLQQTTAGKTVRQLRKSPMSKVSTLATEIVGVWRKSVGGG